MALVVTRNANYPEMSWGAFKVVFGTMAFDNSYPTGGELISKTELGLLDVVQIIIPPISGFIFDFVESTSKVKVFDSVAGGTPSGSNTAVSAGTPAFTGTDPVSDLNLATPAFSGTGLTAAGQVITTTDNQTMTLNQCAGMWLLSATGATPPNLILSNTAVAGAPAVLTVQGAASTDAGAYKIVKALAPVGTLAALAPHTHAFTGVAVPGGAAAEVGAATDLSALNLVDFIAIGK